jgi:MTH538 TIR-like domain (DUF1863)
MGYKDPTYVIFDGDKDAWAYRFMRGWKSNDKVDFDFQDAHELDNMTSQAQSEQYVKSRLRERMRKSSAVIVLIGESTKNLFKFVRWELDLALELGLPIIAANLNKTNALDRERCPAIIRDQCVVHVPFNLTAIKHALNNWPGQFYSLDAKAKAAGWRFYADEVLANLA